MTLPISAIVLAAGEGSRMKSDRPKPLHLICGRSMVMHVIHSLSDHNITSTVVVVGHGADKVTDKVKADAPAWANISFVTQTQQRGTGDAASVGLTGLTTDDIDDTSTVLVLPGDTPLLTTSTISRLIADHESSGNSATVLTAVMEDPTGYGRIVRHKDGRVLSIVEERDATSEQRALTEINTGIYAFRRDLLAPALRQIGTNNSQAEYYLTDVISVLADMGHRVGATNAPAEETAGVNDRLQLAMAEQVLRERINRSWLLAGVTMLDPSQCIIDLGVTIGRDVTLYPGTILRGTTAVGDRCEIGPNTQLIDCTVGADATVSTTVALSAVIGERSIVGPFASLGPGSRVANGLETGAFYTVSS
jgi:bifunctional UDP-N-acetylglucosamine pyrophosphorylase/glucosamine-1-phosphate N-acetyltransferase